MRDASKTGKSYLMTAAVAAGLLLTSSISHAGTQPYSTSFEASGTGDSLGQSYTAGNLVGQNNWVYEDGEAGGGTASVITGVAGPGSTVNTGTQAIELQTPGTNAGYFDVYNANLADHAGTTAGVIPGTTAGTPLDPTLSGGVVNVSFSMNHVTGLSGDGAGIDIFDSADNLVAALFAVTNATTGSHDLEVYDAATNGFDVVQGPAGAGLADNNYGTYHMSLNFNNDTFSVALDGNTAVSQEYAMGVNDGLIGGIAFATDDVNSGTAAQAYFDDLNVVPEPASIGMVAAGGMMMFLRRRRRSIA